MTSEAHADTYHCDLCGSGPWVNGEVGEIRVSFWKPPYRVESDNPRHRDAERVTEYRFDACRKCLDTPRVPNPDIKYEEYVGMPRYNSGVERVARRVLRLFGIGGDDE